MRWPCKVSLASSLAITLALPRLAQNYSPSNPPTPSLTTSPVALTGKERLGRKWPDEQRLDNCNVPIDKRGSRPRPSLCPHVPMG